MSKPLTTLGMRHIALTVKNLSDCVDFYCKLLKMEIEWQPDADNVYLTSGHDNLALHRVTSDEDFSKLQRLDHLGFILETESLVDEWYEFLVSHQVKIKAKPRVHRDGTKSFYCYDPDGNVVQFIYHPVLAKINKT